MRNKVLFTFFVSFIQMFPNLLTERREKLFYDEGKKKICGFFPVTKKKKTTKQTANKERASKYINKIFMATTVIVTATTIIIEK